MSRGYPTDGGQSSPKLTPIISMCWDFTTKSGGIWEFPDVRVVKALNTVNCDIMIAPSRVPGDHDLFICGDDAAAKREVTDRLCEWFGWKPDNIVDLGDITNARGTEMFLALWVRLWGVLGTPHFNIHVVRGT